MTEPFSSNLRKMRNARGVSSYTLADMIEGPVPVRSYDIQQYESGKVKNPDLVRVIEIALALDVSVEELSPEHAAAVAPLRSVLERTAATKKDHLRRRPRKVRSGSRCNAEVTQMRQLENGTAALDAA